MACPRCNLQRLFFGIILQGYENRPRVRGTSQRKHEVAARALIAHPWGGLLPSDQPGRPVLHVVQHREKVCKNAEQTPLEFRAELLVHHSRGDLPAPTTLVVALKENVLPIFLSLQLQGTQVIHEVR